MTLSKEFLLSRGSCCGLGCKNCPYTKPPKKGNKEIESNNKTSDKKESK